jgi:hypothetical protein
MGYIIKDTAALLTTKVTDAARKKMSEGTFNITYFQVGDSEVCYDCISGEDLTIGMVLDSEYNAQNLSPIPEKNKGNIKYPLRVTSTNTNSYGIPVKASYIDNIFNTAGPRGLFKTGTTNNVYDVVRTGTAYTVNPNYIFNTTNVTSGKTISLTADVVDSNTTGTTSPGDFAVFYFGQSGTTINSDSPILTYKVINITGNTSTNSGTVTIEVDRQLPQLNSMGYTGNGRVVFYPSGMTELYDSYTPSFYWESDAIDFESNCDVSNTDVKVWNMNIPWTESPAGVASVNYKGYTTYPSRKYIGSKEYLGYNSNTGQTDTSSTYYYNSFADKINLSPSNQKAIAIVHYTNQAIDNYYGEKLAMQPYDASNPGDTGQARNFKITLPWLMWHKSSDSNIGEVFYTDPPGYSNLNLFSVQYMKSIPNTNMNDPGLRYYHLWDTNTNTNGYPNRVGKVWPDLKLITFDDDEIIAALSYKSNRNWTLPAPKLGLIVPNTCNDTDADDEGLLSGSSQSLWVTYRLNSSAFTESIHCNYYSLISGTDPDCPPDTADVTFRLGDEFPFLQSVIDSSIEGFTANEISILAQKVTTGQKPNPSQWREIDVTSQLESTKVNGFLTVSGLTNTTISINKPNYESAGLYNLVNYIDIPGIGSTGQTLNFGDEYLFYGEVQSDIQATIYVLNYLCNLGQGQFMTSSNPTWSTSDTPYVSEVGLYDSDKNLMIISKVQSPEQRLGVQQYNIKIDL